MALGIWEVSCKPDTLASSRFQTRREQGWGAARKALSVHVPSTVTGTLQTRHWGEEGEETVRSLLQLEPPVVSLDGDCSVISWGWDSRDTAGAQLRGFVTRRHKTG